MSQPVNLNKYRKSKARAEKQARAKENTVKFGRTKAEKRQHAQQAKTAARLLEHHKCDS